MEQLFKGMGRKMSKKELAQAMSAMDNDGNAQINFMEFQAWWTEHEGEIPTDTVPQWIAAIDDAIEQSCGTRPVRAEFAGTSYEAGSYDGPEAVLPIKFVGGEYADF